MTTYLVYILFATEILLWIPNFILMNCYSFRKTSSLLMWHIVEDSMKNQVVDNFGMVIPILFMKKRL